MGPVLQELGQAIIGRRPLGRFVQIDRLVTVQTGTGTIRRVRGAVVQLGR